MKKLLLLVGLVVFSLSAKSEENNIFCYKGHGSSAGLLPHNSSNSICSIPVDSKYVINNRWINNKYCKKLKIKNECLCIKRNQIKLFEEGKITSICEKEDLSEINYKNTKSVKHNETSIENSISKIDNKKFCTKTTNINFKNGNSSWEKKIKQGI